MRSSWNMKISWERKQGYSWQEYSFAFKNETYIQTDAELCAMLNPHLCAFLKTLPRAMSLFLLREDGPSPASKIIHSVMQTYSCC